MSFLYFFKRKKKLNIKAIRAFTDFESLTKHKKIVKIISVKSC